MVYDPLRFVVPDRYGIGAATQEIASGIEKLPTAMKQDEEYKYQQEQRQKAVEEAKRNWGAMESSWKTIKSQYQKKAQPLIEKGLMTQEDLDTDLRMLRMPTDADKKDPGAYIDNTGKTFANLIQKIEQKSRQAGLTGAVAEASRERFGAPTVGEEQQVQTPTGETFTEAPITSRPRMPGAQTQQEFAQAPEVQAMAPTTEELGQVPQYATAPTAEGLQKQQLAQDKLDIQKMKTQLATDKESNINWYRSKLIEMKEATDDLSRMKARKDLEKFDVALISLVDEATEKLKELENPVDDLGDPLPKDPIEIARVKKALEDYKKIRQQLPKLELQTIRKGTTLDAGTGQVTPATQPERTQRETTRERYTAQTTMSPMEKGIRDTLAKKTPPVDQRTIDAYIEDLKRRGEL